MTPVTSSRRTAPRPGPRLGPRPWAQLGIALALAAVTGLVWSVTGAGYFWPRWVWFGLGAVLTGEYVFRRAWQTPPGRGRMLAVEGAAVVLLAVVDLVVWALSGFGFFWPVFSIVGFSTAFGVHAWIVGRRPDQRELQLTARVDTLSRTRRGALDEQAAELKRIERDLHDGAQARIVSLALSLGLAEDLVRRDPDSAIALLAEARTTAIGALDDLRTVMSGIAPAVLADRGLGGGIRALVLDLAVPVDVHGDPPDDLPPALESAAYFATAECLANTVKHSRASRATVTFTTADGALRIVVHDDGVGGAVVGAGSGLRGVASRLEAFDGAVDVDSPPGGPTNVTIEIPTPDEPGGNVYT